jgi:ABC-type branched-subunit amino acid transport system ATPase component
MKILETKNLSKHFEGVRAIDGLSIAIEKGKITSIIGPNGSGKTTLINLISGMIPFDKGAVVVNGTKLTRVRPHDVPTYGITRTFQDVRLFEQMPVLDNVLVVLTERGVWSALFERHTEFHLKRAEEVLTTVGLWKKRNELANNLSYGQRKLLEIARVLAMDTDIILLDEPFAGLFREMVKKVKGIVQKLRDEGKTIIFIEHNMELIRELSDYTFVMESGELLAEGAPKEVLAKGEVIEAYLGE